MSFDARNRVVAVACTVGLVAVFGAFATQTAVVPNEVRITGTDYAYVEVPVTVAPGLTYFAFKNAGKARHEMSLLRLEPGISPAQVVENLKAGGKGRRALFKTVGILIEPPGGATIGWLAMNLKRGETYVIICSLRDTPDALQHFELGMYSAFTVR